MLRAPGSRERCNNFYSAASPTLFTLREIFLLRFCSYNFHGNTI